MAIKVGINGLGSIGRRFLRCALERPGIEVVAANDVGDPATMAHLVRYDSNYGTLAAEVTLEGRVMRVQGRAIEVLSERDPARLPWGQLGVEVVVECTGIFRDRASVSRHLQAGARKVVISSPAKDDDLTCVIGVNDHLYDPARHTIISNASCTTNCLAPVAKVLDERFGIESGLMSTVHAYTNDQVILDHHHDDIRRARAGATNIVPTSTGAASAIGKILPSLQGRLNGTAFRVPVPAVSVLDLVVCLRSVPSSAEQLNAAFAAAAAAGPLQGILGYSEEPLVSSDYRGDPRSAIVDALETKLVGQLAKVVAWYDNEWAYSMRLVDLCLMVGRRGV